MRARIKKASISHPLRLKTPCALCRHHHPHKNPLCRHCETLLPPLGPACMHCATPLLNTSSASHTICGFCIKQPPALDYTYTPYRYLEPLRTLVHDFKYRQQLHLSPFLAEKMLLSSPRFTPNSTCLIPIPMHPKRTRTRGFNQAAVLTQTLAKKCNIPYLLKAIKKTENTAPQAELLASKRKHNMKHSFKINPIPYTHVVLIDDLVTTGSTANELASALKLTGIKQVDLWCIAKTCLD